MVSPRPRPLKVQATLLRLCGKCWQWCEAIWWQWVQGQQQWSEESLRVHKVWGHCDWLPGFSLQTIPWIWKSGISAMFTPPPFRVNVKARLEKIFSWCDPNLYVIKPRFILGVKCEGQDDMILKFPMAPSDCVYQFKRFQFPVWVSQLLHDSQQESGTDIAKCWTVPGAKRVLWTQTILRVSMTRVGDERKVFVHSKDGRCKNIVHQAALTWLKRTKLENHQLNDTVSFWSLTLHRNSVWSIQMSYLKFTLN